MPELPDVEIFNRLVRDHCRGRAVEWAEVTDAGILEGISGGALERRLKGERVLSSQRYGKHLFIVLGEAGALAMHFGTNGSLRVVARGEEVPNYTRLALHFEKGDWLAYLNPRRIGRVSLCESAGAFIAQSGLGPDVLDPTFDLRAFMALLAASKRDIKSLLMDQTSMAGIGNIYSDEILFQARIHPSSAASQLDRESASRLFRAMRKTLETAIACGAGSGQAAERLRESFLLPHRHRGGQCPRCGTSLATVKHVGRTTYYCPRCQPT